MPCRLTSRVRIRDTCGVDGGERGIPCLARTRTVRCYTRAAQCSTAQSCDSIHCKEEKDNGMRSALRTKNKSSDSTYQHASGSKRREGFCLRNLRLPEPEADKLLPDLRAPLIRPLMCFCSAGVQEPEPFGKTIIVCGSWAVANETSIAAHNTTKTSPFMVHKLDECEKEWSNS